MKHQTLRHLVIIVASVFFLDWILGALCASGMWPVWTFLSLNLPFGAFYVWMESSWMGTHYEMLGHNVGDVGSLVIFLFVVLAQSLFYFALFEWIRRRCGRPLNRTGIPGSAG
jgi:hypothetical protein